MNIMNRHGTDGSIALTHFELQTPCVSPKEELAFTFTLRNSAAEAKPVDIRYQIAFPDASGEQRLHTYKISDRICPVGFLFYNRKHALEQELPACASSPSDDLLYFPGAHKFPGILRLLVNGDILQETEFQIVLS